MLLFEMENNENISYQEASEIYLEWQQDPDSLSLEDKTLLYNYAKDAYYNGEELMSDSEFDELERQMKLENKGYIGSKNGNYDVKHSFIMGSLSKVQIKEDKNSGLVDWDKFANELSSYIGKSHCSYFETTPKLDGCSFSAEFKLSRNGAKLISISTRGDGEYGSDISKQFESLYNSSPYWKGIDDAVSSLCDRNTILVIRGEVLIPKTSFSSSYQNDFTNPRSFVAGTLGVKWENTREQIQMAGELHFVCYDYRLYNTNTGYYKELSWMNPNDETYKLIKPFLGSIGELPDTDYCQVHKFNGKITGDQLQSIYEDYDVFRKQYSEYALDGIVFKPSASSRLYNSKKVRPDDCVAMKFLPMISTTTITNIKWQIGKTGEYTPVAILKTFNLDGKAINKAALHNYNYILQHQCGIGSTVRISLAGDIIPFVYEVVQASGIIDDENGNNINKPEDSYIVVDPNSNVKHLMKQFSADDKEKNQFIMSVTEININTLGKSKAIDLWETLHSLYPEGLINICQLMDEEGSDNIINNFGNSKTSLNIIKGLEDYKMKMELPDLIRSFCFKQCGKVAADACAKLMSNIEVSIASLPRESYIWATDPNSYNYKLVDELRKKLDIPLLTSNTGNSGKIPILMTGSPAAFGYKTKSAFLNAHPQYCEGTAANMKILFTDDKNSTSGKMKAAAKKGIPIMTYDEAPMPEENQGTYGEELYENIIHNISNALKNALF